MVRTKPVLLSALLAATPAQAGGTLNFMAENDSFQREIDRHYTNGLYLSFTAEAQSAARARRDSAIADAVMLPGAPGAELRHGWFLGQAIYTPENLAAAVPPANDRPYAGWLYGGLRLYRDSGDILDRADITLGVVGPAALGADLQNWWHGLNVLGGFHANGWHYQLRDEPGLVFSEQRIERVALLKGPLEMEILPQANVALGNIYDYAAAGGMLRLGQGLQSDWGPPRMAPALQGSDFQSVHGFAWYVFAGLEARAVARNLFLDGNSFETSRSVPRQWAVGDIDAGFAMMSSVLRFELSYTQRTREFRGQRGNDEFISGTLSIAL